MGLFRKEAARAEHQDSALLDAAIKLHIQLRNEARKDKNYALGDRIRKGLADIGITLEDRPDGTLWRRS